MDFITEATLQNFAEIQQKILLNFLRLYPGAIDDFILAVPKHGELDIDSETWRFLRHGLGCRFKNLATGVIVDVHRLYKIAHNPIDAWRILQYIESLGSPETNFSDVNEKLAELEGRGFLERTGHDGVYRLASME